MTSNTARDALYARLRDVLGENDARTMMQLLPPGDWDQVATKADIGRLEDRMHRLEGRMDRLEGRVHGLERSMDKFDDRLHDFHGALREQTRNFILASTASVVTVGGLAFAAASLI